MNRIFKKSLFFLVLISGLIFSQQNFLNFTSGEYVISVEPNVGNFSIFDSGEDNLALSSVLFGSSIAPSSSFVVYVDDEPYYLNQMEALYPLGTTVGSQIDGIYLLGENNNLRLEVSYFAMDIDTNTSQNTLGVAFSLSNLSSNRLQNVRVKVMLDTDIGENIGFPRAFLPNGQQISESFIFDSTQIPPYLFFGQAEVGSGNNVQGEGVYIYPFLTTNLPSSITVANFRRLSDTQWVRESIEPSFSYAFDKSPDLGVALYFGEYEIAPRSKMLFGFAVSKNFTSLWPILDDELIENGVFNPSRFAVEEVFAERILNTPRLPNHVINQRDPRQQYRLEILGLIEKTNSHSNDIEYKFNENADKNSLDLNFRIKFLEHEIQKTLEKNFTEPTSYTNPPAQGIIFSNY